MELRWIRRLLGGGPPDTAAPLTVPPHPAVPAGHRVYAVGDIHGRADLLRRLRDIIVEDAKDAPEGIEKTLIYLGDYVDRGLESKDVIDVLLAPPADTDVVHRAVYLRGNHEDAMLRFLADASIGPAWFAMGGDATAYSYGVGLPKGLSQKARFQHVQQALHERIPATHVAFLASLPLLHTAGDYLFVHAGVRPGVPIEQQSQEDLLWIREDFLAASAGWDKVVVHGHSATYRPESLPHRIGVDTGAYATNVLTCLALEGTERRFLST